MSGEHNLKILLKNMKPEMQEGIFVFCTLPQGQKVPSNIEPVHIFREQEGITIVVRLEEAEALKLSYQFKSCMITLMIHSALDAVGFLAAVTTCLAKGGISVNPVSAYYHDHLFVPYERANDAMQLLHSLTE